jgi:hypothetical protein
MTRLMTPSWRGKSRFFGATVIFPVHRRPVEGTRGPYRVTMRHGVGNDQWTSSRTLRISLVADIREGGCFVRKFSRRFAP